MVRIGKVEVHSIGDPNGYVINNKPVQLKVEILNPNKLDGNIEVAGVLRNQERTYINYFGTRLKKHIVKLTKNDPSIIVEAVFDVFPFIPGKYFLGLEVSLNKELAYWKDMAIAFTIEEIDFYNSGDAWHKGLVLLSQKWTSHTAYEN